MRFSIISVRFVCDFSQDRPERFDSLSAETIGESAVSTFRCSERARGLRELQTRAFCEKSYAHSVPKKAENVDSELVLRLSRPTDSRYRCCYPISIAFPNFRPNATGFRRNFRNFRRARPPREVSGTRPIATRAGTKTPNGRYVTRWCVFFNRAAST